VLTGSTPVLPAAFQNSLNVGGRLFAIVGDAPVMEAKLITRVAPRHVRNGQHHGNQCRTAAECRAAKRFVF